MTAPTAHLRAGRIKPILGRHPWVFAGSIERVSGSPADGDAIDLVAPDGRFLARALWSGRSQISARVFSYTPGEAFDAELVKRRLEGARDYRARGLDLPHPSTTGYRLVHSEADGIPGLVVDVHADVVAMQLSIQATDRLRGEIVGALEALLRPRAIVETSDAHRALEGLAPASGLRAGALGDGQTIRERGIAYAVDCAAGQKTGFYYDQRDNRARVARLARGRSVLDAFCYSGAFALAAWRGGAREVVGVESSAPALELARRSIAANEATGIELVCADVYRHLGELRRAGRTYELVITDPPRYATRRGQLGAALQKYRELAGLALAVTAPGGVLVCCSCSGLVDEPAFEATVREAAVAAGRAVRIFARGEQAGDHPTSLYCPEGRYLKALFLHVE